MIQSDPNWGETVKHSSEEENANILICFFFKFPMDFISNCEHLNTGTSPLPHSYRIKFYWTSSKLDNSDYDSIFWGVKQKGLYICSYMMHPKIMVWLKSINQAQMEKYLSCRDSEYWFQSQQSQAHTVLVIFNGNSQCIYLK